jgi:PhnB protein
MADALIDRVDRLVEVLLRREDATAALSDSELATLARLAADLRHCPEAGFRARLRARLERTAVVIVEQELATVTPYLIVPDGRLVEFLARTFGAVESFSARGSAGGMHREVQLGTSTLMIGELAGAEVRPMELHVYVDDVDTTFRTALEAGATSIGEPANRPYGERSGFVRDVFGNHWFIARALRGPATPEGLRTVTPFLHVARIPAYLDFLGLAFGATPQRREDAPGGRVVYARARVGDSVIELGEATETAASMPGFLHLKVANVDAVYERAVTAGARSIAAPSLQLHGRTATVEDPIGNQWFIAGV